ncbi:hypothetical protein CF319_g3106 [Tilletia indica]|nr:hypothetical protein CF319_g3106 [Tilletia indica]
MMQANFASGSSSSHAGAHPTAQYPQQQQQQQSMSNQQQQQQQQPSRSRTSKRAANISSSDSGSGISTATFALPPFNAPSHSSYQSAPAPATVPGSLPPPLLDSSSSSAAASVSTAQPLLEPHHLQPQPQYRTSAATAQRKLVAAQRARLTALSKNLTTRLQYASFKVEHGWTGQSLSEVENLYYRTVMTSRLRGRGSLEASVDRAGVVAESSATGSARRRKAPSSTAAGKRKARDSTDAATSANAGPSSTTDISPTASSVTTSPQYSAGVQASSVPASPAWPVPLGSTIATASLGSHPNPRTHIHTVATGSPPQKRPRYSKGHGANEGMSGAGGGGAGAGGGGSGHHPGKSPTSPLKLSNASLGGGKQDLFTAHGLVTPPSFLGTALFPKDQHQQLQGLQNPQSQHPQQQQQQQQRRPSIPHAMQAPQQQPNVRMQLLPSAQVNGHPQHFHPTPPLSEQLMSPVPPAALLPPATVPSQSRPPIAEQRRTPPREGIPVSATTPVLPSSSRPRRPEGTPTLLSNSTSKVYAPMGGSGGGMGGSGGGAMGPPPILMPIQHAQARGDGMGTNTVSAAAAAAAMATVLAEQSGLGR